ncbi:hypothetical protein M404DRAFT_996616 [Pisolithus tinctorius Marx 270]|uniref:Uncharacterized protein n=1 Tax=Pisolithus tinctorius Marx 270 TaxID=870435 RepID=A0A0C3KJK4_PISTI|nr:hypothetical protein M404DRAFT_996616 [Pisolithus tinctorius Marx 270]
MPRSQYVSAQCSATKQICRLRQRYQVPVHDRIGYSSFHIALRKVRTHVNDVTADFSARRSVSISE